MEKQKCAIYCRVSTPDQDISKQIEQLPRFAESKGWEVFDKFIDEGISGATIGARPDFKRLLDAMIHKKFNILLVEFQDRITRTENLQERGLILQTIKDNNITLYSPSEGPCDLSDFSGEIVSTIKFIISAEERKRIKERTINGKKAKLENGIPTALGGKLPIARTYHKETGKWTLDEEKAKLLRWAANQYLQGESLRDIANILTTKHFFKIGYQNLIRTLSERCGSTWSVKLMDFKTFNFEIPRILDDDTIKAINDRIAFNTTFNRKDVRKYVLNGFIRCAKCHRALNGQKQKTQSGDYIYYRHPVYDKGGKSDCKAFASIGASKIEYAVFTTIFENVCDEVGFQRAIKDSMPDAKRIRSLKSKIHKNEKNLNRVNHKIRDLYLKDIDGKYDDKEIVKGIQADLLFAKDQIQKELDRDKQKLESMPSIKRTEWEAKLIRYGLMDYFGSQKHLNEMLYSDKRELLHWMFNGADGNGDRFGIYVEKQDKMWHYTISARMMLGTRTIFKNDIDYDGWDEDYKLEFYKTKRLCPK